MTHIRSFICSLIVALLGALLLGLSDFRRGARRRGYRPSRFIHLPWVREVYNPSPLRWLNRFERRRRWALMRAGYAV